MILVLSAATGLAAQVRLSGLEAAFAGTLDEALPVLSAGACELALLDPPVPGVDAESWAEAAPGIPLLVLDDGVERVDAEATGVAVRDSIRRDHLTPERLRHAVRHAIERQKLRRRIAAACRVVEDERAEKKRMDSQLGREDRELDLVHKMVSHDLNEPLSKMVGYAEFILDRHGRALGPEARTALAALRECQETLRDVLDRIVAAGRARTRG